MRSGNYFQFRYEKSTQKMQLIGMQRYNFGPANHDGSGESSVNLLTNRYIGEWNFFDVEQSKLIKIPSIKRKMTIAKSYFDKMGSVYSEYEEKDTQYYLEEKKRRYNKK